MRKTINRLHPVRLVIRHPKMALLAAIILTAVSLYFGSKIELRSNFSDLLPDDHPAVIQARTLDNVVGGASFIVVAVETEDRDAAVSFIEDLHGKVSGLDDVLYVDDRSPEYFFHKHGMLYLSLDDLEDIKQRIKRKIERTKLAQTGFFIELEDEEEASFDLTKFRGKYAPYFNPDSYYQNAKGTFFVSLIKPDWRTTRVARTEKFLESLKTVLKELNPQSYHSSLSVRLTGPYVKAMAQQKILKRDATIVSLLALLGSIAYLIFHFRRKRAVFLIAVPLVVSVSCTLALAYAFYGSLNLFSSVACAIIIGLAADYGIHLYSEYLQQRSDGVSAEEAFLLAIEHLKKPFFIAATTTAAAFFSLGLSRFKAFSEFGMIAGPGILICAVTFTFLMPPLALWMESWSPEKIAERPARTFRKLSSGRLARWTLSRRAPIIVGCVLILPLIVVAKGWFYFDYNMDHIMGHQPTKALDQRVDAIFSNTVNPEVALVDHEADAARLAAALRDTSDRNAALPIGTTINDVVALSDFVPKRQSEKIQKIGEIRALLTPRVVDALNDEDREAYRDFEAMLNPVPVDRDSLPQKILNKFTDRTGSVGRILFIFPNFSISDSDKFLHYAEEIRSATCSDCVGSYYVSGESTVFYEIIKMLFSEGKFVMSTALIAVFLLLWINFRSFQETWRAFAPLLLSMIALAGWMALLDVPLNMINMAAFPIVLGVVTDYVVHFYQRYREDSDKEKLQAYRASFGPILGSTITSLIGFGALLAADMGGLRSMGAVTALGILLGSVTTLFWFPGFLSVAKRTMKTQPSVLKEEESRVYEA